MAEEEEEESGGTPTGARPFWSGTITFGLVSIPVSLFAANRPRSFAFRMVAPEGTPVERRYVCPEEEKPLNWDDIVRGYEIEKGKFVVVTDDELEAIEPRKSRDIDLRLFVDLDEIDPALFERGYFLTPAGGSNKAYRLLASVMEKSNRAGIATFVMRTKEYVIAIIAEKGILRAETLRFIDELRKPEDVGLPKIKKPKPADVKKFERAIETHTKKVAFSEFLDEYAERVQKLVEKKERQHKDVVEKPETETEEKGGEVIDLLQVLSRSLQSADAKKSGGSRSSSGKRSATRKSSTRKPPKRAPRKSAAKSTRKAK